MMERSRLLLGQILLLCPVRIKFLLFIRLFTIALSQLSGRSFALEILRESGYR